MTTRFPGTSLLGQGVPIGGEDRAACQGRQGLARRLVAGSWRRGSGGRARPDGAGPPARRRGRPPLADPGRVGPGRLRDPLGRLRHHPGVPVVPARDPRLHRPGFGSPHAVRRGPAAARKALAAAAEMPTLESVVLIDGSAQGAGGTRPRVLDWEGLRALGRGPHPPGRPRGAPPGRHQVRDVATIVYTSGTTGRPEGRRPDACEPSRGARHDRGRRSGVREGDVHLLFLPLAHSFARMEGFLGVRLGLITAFAESLERLAENLREVSPDFICSVPRVFEKVYAKILLGVAAAAPPLRRKDLPLGAGRGSPGQPPDGEGRAPVPAGLRAPAPTRRAGWCSHKLHAALGGRLRFCVSGGRAAAREIAEFFHAVGILILEGYGLTETCPILAANRPEAFKFGTVGRPFAGVEAQDRRGRRDPRPGAPTSPRATTGSPRRQPRCSSPTGWFHTGRHRGDRPARGSSGSPTGRRI